MTEDKKPWFKTWGWALLVLLLIVCVFGYFAIKNPRADIALCCDVVCGKLGYNVECIGSFNDRITCGFPYDKFGMPEIEEVFEFRVTDYSICEPADTSEVANETEEQG